MENIYPLNIIMGFFWHRKREELASGRKLFFILNFLILFSYLFFTPTFSNAQKLDFSYSYQNVTRNSGGGTLENGDIIEVHALVKVNATTKSFYYIDSIPTGTQYVSNSLKIVTNEGLLFKGPYTNTSNDDLGVYVGTGNSRIRVNIGTGASNATSGPGFGSTSGGGIVTPGDKPKFYGTTLFIVAYQLKITASFGDTIHLTGNYYFDTSGVNQTFRFDYAGIKIIQNSGLCNNFSSASFTTDSSFGHGSIQNRLLPVIGGNQYTKINMGANAPGDGYYAIANNTSADGTTDNTGPYKPTTNAHRVFGGFWDIIGDHTGAVDPAAGNPPVAPGTDGGYMLVVNAAFPTGEAFSQTISNVCPNTNYEFSAWVRNICGVCGIDQNSAPTYTPGVLPNLSFGVNGVDYYTTGNIPYDKTWQKRGFMYKTGPSETSFNISIKSNAAGGGGDDWVIDDIKLATCYPNLQMNPSDTATACAGWPITLSDTIKSYFNNYGNYRWETSTDGINWTPSNLGSTRAPHLVNGLYVYYVDTVITPKKSDSATYFRVKVATTSGNLSATNCSVDKSQKVFLKVYSTSCPLLDVKILNFNGAIINDKAVLKWAAQNENDLKQYVVQRSPDGIHFSDIGQLSTVNGLNTANYTLADPESVFNVVYYRLQLVNRINNDLKYSRIISLYNKNTPFKITTINPFTSSVKMDVFLPAQGNVEFSLCDMYGNAVNKKVAQLYQGNSQVSIDNVSGLPPGLYILRALYNGSVLQYKLIKTY
jgi:hypothetical protein